MQNQWYIARDGKQYGPVTDHDLAQLVRDRELLDGDYLWRNGFDNWLPAAQVAEVRELASKNVVPPAGQVSDPDPQKKENGHALNSNPEPHSGAHQKQFNPHATQEQGDPFEPSNVVQQGADTNKYVDFKKERFDQRAVDTQALDPQARQQAVSKDPNRVKNEAPLVDDGKGSFGRVEQGEIQDLIEDEGPVESILAPSAQEPYVPERGYEGLGNAYDANTTSIQPNYDHKNAYEASSAHETSLSYDKAASKSGLSWPLGLGIGIAALLVLAIGATFALPFIVPPETIKKQISLAIKEKTGRDVSFKGKMSYRFFPSFGLDLNNIVIHNPPEIKGPDFVSIGRLQANLKLLPLLSKKVEVEKVIFHRPEIALITDGKGRTNYEIKSAALNKSYVLPPFKVAQDETLDTSDIIARTLERLEKEKAEKEAAQKEAGEKTAGQETKSEVDPKGPTVDDVKSAATPDDNIQIGEIEIINGGLKLIDQKTNKETAVEAINMKVRAPGADKDVTADGSVRFKQDRIKLNGTVSTLGLLINDEPAQANFQANSERFEGTFDGHLRLKDGWQLQGDADVQTFSLQKLLSWFDVDVPTQGFGGAYVRGRLLASEKVLMLKNTTIKLDKTRLIGDVRVLPQGVRPKIEAILKTDFLNLDPYLAQKKPIKRGSLHKGYKTAVAAWNSQKIDFGALRSFDVLMQLDAGRLNAMGHSIQQARLNTKVNAGVLTAVLPNFKLYGGDGVMNLVLNGAKARPSLKGKINLKQVQMKPLLTNSAGLKFISGAADVVLDVISSGASQKEMISGLNGTGKIAVADGALEGVNIPGLLRNLQKGRLDKLVSKPTEKTDFSELTASFSIEGGVVKNQDLLMKGPLLRMSGKGIVNLPAEQIDYGLTPKVVSSLQGQGGDANKQGIQIPLRVKGPLANPSILPDAKGLLGNGEAIKDTVKTVEKVVKDIKKKKISGEQMKSLLEGMIDGNGENGNLLDGVLP